METRTVARKAFSVIGKVLGTILLICVLGALIFACFFTVYVKTNINPYLEVDAESFTLDQTSVIYYQDSNTGEYMVLQNLYGSENRIWTPYESIPKNLKFAAIAIEDKRFEDHKGVDWYRTSWAFVNMFLGMKDTFGGSTITQQLLKNITNEDEITVRRKLIEIFRALQFEKEYTKEEILELYFNTIYFGESSYGVYSASRLYFGKDVSELNLAECASLVGITNNPSIYDPYINPEKNIERQRVILYEMLDQGYITQLEYNEALNYKLVFMSVSGDETATTVYSYAVDEIIRAVVSDLSDLTGYSTTVLYQMVNSGGYKIYSTIDIEAQWALEAVFTNRDSLPASVGTYQQLQAGMVILNNETGDIAAICGGLGEKTGSLTLNRATQSTRSPGSVIKPLSVYAPALDLGLITPISVYDDTPLTFETNPWPKNYDSTYHGLMTIAEAVAISNNTIPAKLVTEMTPEYCYNYLIDKFKISTLVAAKEVSGGVLSDIYVAPMALGGLTNGVTVLEIAEAYEAIANSGIYRDARIYTRVEDASGKIILDNTSESSVAVKPKTASYLTAMMEGVVSFGTGTDAALANMAVAGKTGTTTNDYDRWFSGYTPYYCGAVWIGYDEQEEIVLADSTINPAATLWRLVMEKLHENKSGKSFQTPSSVVEITYCRDSGKLATDNCRNDIRGSRVESDKVELDEVPVDYCTLHISVEICDESGHIATEYCPATTRTSMINLLRQFPTSGVVIQDQKYMVGFLHGTIATGYYSAATGDPDAINYLCPLHGEEIVEEEEEEGEEEPEESPTPSDTQRPAASPSPSVAPSPSPSQSAQPSPSPSQSATPEPSQSSSASPSPGTVEEPEPSSTGSFFRRLFGLD